MANSIALAKNYIPLLDEIYKKEALTAFLGDVSGLVRQGLNGKEIIYPQYSMAGLSDYDRATGYKNGNVKLEWKTIAPDYDRGTKFQVDTMDNLESMQLAFGALGAEFMRTQVIPESDAWTFAKIAQKTGITAKGEDIADATAFLDALVAAKTLMDEAEVPNTDRLLFATPTLMNALINMDTSKSKEALNAFSVRVEVPQSRFYTAITLQDTSGGDGGGFIKDVGSGKDINFMIVHRPAIIKYQKHQASDIITPEANQTADAYMLKFRTYAICDVYDNKVKGVYVSHKTA